jgi:hypothetical protein
VTSERRLPDLSNLVQVPRYLGPRPTTASALTGLSPQGRPVEAAFSSGWTLLLFLSTTCDGCLELWAAFADRKTPIDDDLAAVLVTKPASDESTDEVVRLAGSTTVVMSESAWLDYEVHSGPFFVIVDGRTRRIASEGVAWSVEQMAAAFAAVRTRASLR